MDYIFQTVLFDLVIVRDQWTHHLDLFGNLSHAGLIQPEHATLEGFENTDLSDIKVGIDCAFAEVKLGLNLH